MLAGCTAEALRVLQHAVAVTVLRRVFLLRVEIRVQHDDRVALVRADTAVDELVLALFGREPPALAALHQRNRHRPRLIADQQHAPILPLLVEKAIRLHRGDRLGARRRVCRPVGRDDQCLVLVAEDRD